MTYDFNIPFVDSSSRPIFIANHTDVAADFGLKVRAVEMSNANYHERYTKFACTAKMKPPPSHHRIFPDYLVIRKLGTSQEYETWVPDHVFEDLYAAGDAV